MSKLDKSNGNNTGSQGTQKKQNIITRILSGSGRKAKKDSQANNPTQPKSTNTGKAVRTVRGPMAPEELGFTSMHEHALFRPTPGPVEAVKTFGTDVLGMAADLIKPDPIPKSFFPQKNNPITIENRGYLYYHFANAEDAYGLDEGLMTGEIGEFAAIGGKSILDCSVPYERGNPEIVRRISEKTGVNIVMSTGVNLASMVPKRYRKMNVAQMIGFFEKELNEGIDHTDIQAGQIKLYVDGKKYIGRDELKPDGVFMTGLEAAANVAANTGAPVTIHVYDLDQEEYTFLLSQAKKYGMPMDRMIFAHSDTMVRKEMFLEKILKDPECLSLNLEPCRRALNQGVVLSFDLLGTCIADTRAGHTSMDDAFALASISQYLREGYADQIVLGTDTWIRLNTRRYGGHGMIHLINYAIPTLLKYGTSQKDIDRVTIDNPARLLAF